MQCKSKTFRFSQDKGLEHGLVELFKRFYRRPKRIVQTGGNIELVNTILNVYDRLNVKNRPFYNVLDATEANVTLLKETFKERRYRKISAYHAIGPGLEESLESIENHPCFLQPNSFPDLRVDADSPIPFYTSEVKGELFGGNKPPIYDWFTKLRPGNGPYLFLLAGIGGIGYVEWLKIRQVMGDRIFHVLLTGIDHVKHFHVWQEIQERDNWSVEAIREESWVLATHYRNYSGAAKRNQYTMRFPRDPNLETR